MTKFIGRKSEFELLKGLLLKSNSSLVVIRGRRRIGKSRLAEEFAKLFPKVLNFSGIPPEDGVTAKIQRKEFLRQLQEYRIPSYRSDDWGDLFFDLYQECTNGPVLVILDEITWMGSKDPTFLPKLKTAWDRHFKKNPQLIMILSGSNSAWISKNILKSTGFFGRISLRILLKELSLQECNRFWNSWQGKIAAYEKFKILSVTGGVPRYLEELRPDLSAERNLQNLCFNPEGLLFNEFDQIFHDLFQRQGEFYKRIVEELVDQQLSSKELATHLGRSPGGDLSEALDQLTQSGFLSKDYSWNLATGKQSKVNRYRVQDNYLRFYLKYIKPHKEQIETGQFRKLPHGWHSIMGLQFENLVVNNGISLCHLLGIDPDEVVIANPFLQTKTSRREGCQIDYMIQTRFNNLYLCEVKFRKEAISEQIIDEVETKLQKLQLPRGFSIRPVLIHVNGVVGSVKDSGYFSRLVDFSEFLTS